MTTPESRQAALIDYHTLRYQVAAVRCENPSKNNGVAPPERHTHLVTRSDARAKSARRM